MKTTTTTKVLFSKGNKKLPSDTFILNMGSATSCPAEKLGLCPVAEKCYAKKAERMYPSVLPYREKQRDQFNTLTAEEIANGMLFTATGKRTKMRNLRFSEAGDFEDQKDIEKMVKIAKILRANGVRTYGYTARTDLDLSALVLVASVNVSNDLNKWKAKGANRFEAVKEFSGKALRCAGDCRICTLCSRLTGKQIEVELH